MDYITTNKCLRFRRDPTYDSSRDLKGQNGAPPNSKTSDAIYEQKPGTNNISNYASQRQLSKSPEPIYNAHNLSLPLKNTATNRLENNKSPYNYQDATPSKAIENSDNRLIQKSSAYVDNRNVSHQRDHSSYNYPKEKQNVYGESGYQKMIQQQQEYKTEDSREQYMQDIYQQNVSNHPAPIERQAFERRTPDTYGRSAVIPGYYNKGRAGDYEDVYNNSANDQNYTDTYQRPLSPMAYEDRKISAQFQNQRYESSNNDNVSIIVDIIKY